MVRPLVAHRGANGHHLVASRVEFGQKPPDVAALPGRIPPLIDNRHGNAFAVAEVLEPAKFVLELLHAFVVLLLV